MAEAYMNHAGAGRWRAYSAGSKPTGAPNPFALKTLSAHAIDAGAPRSKSWDEFAANGSSEAPPLDVVVTVCDNAAGETCPIWPAPKTGAVRTLHWPFPDPAAATGVDKDVAAAFETVFADIKIRIDQFLQEEKG